MADKKPKKVAPYSGYLWDLTETALSPDQTIPADSKRDVLDTAENKSVFNSEPPVEVFDEQFQGRVDSPPISKHDARVRLDAACAKTIVRYKLWHNKPYFAEFYAYAGLKSTIRERRHDVIIRISDLLCGAPVEVLEGILEILLAKFWKCVADPVLVSIYEAYVRQPSIENGHRETRIERGRGKVLVGMKGRYRDLEPLYLQLNQEYFDGRIEVPVSWSLNWMRTMLGYFDPDYCAVIINRRLDSRFVPLYVTTYILYHELLHVEQDRSPVEPGKRRRVHDAEFLRRERQFKNYNRAIDWLQRRGWI